MMVENGRFVGSTAGEVPLAKREPDLRANFAHDAIPRYLAEPDEFENSLRFIQIRGHS